MRVAIDQGYIYIETIVNSEKWALQNLALSEMAIIKRWYNVGAMYIF